MKWNCLISLFSAVCLSTLPFTGCSSQKDAIKKPAQSGAAKKAAAEEKEPETQMKIVYGNKSSRMTLLLDVNSQDVNIEMSGRPQKMAKKNQFPWLDKEKEKDDEESDEEDEEEGEGGRKAKKKGEDQPSEDEEWADVMDVARSGDLSKKDIQQVVAEIRKAQEFFYQKRYPEALDMVKFSLQKQETAEGYALMGSILYMMDDKEAAKESWAQSLRLNPDMPAVTQMMEKLKRGE